MSWMTSSSAIEYRNGISHPNVDTLFLELTAKEFPVSRERLPYYSTSIPVGHLPANASLEVSLNYPEYSPLTNEESRWAKIHDREIQKDIKINSQLSFSRKKGYLDVVFSPIVKREGQYYRLVSCKINVNTNNSRVHLLNRATFSDATERWKKSSVLKEGKWAKIRVKKEGIYTLTPDFLAKMGFSDPNKVKLFGYGGRILEEDWTFEGNRQVSDDLVEVPLYRKNNGEALFFAEGTLRWTYNSNHQKWIHENNPYSNYSYYLITEGSQPSTFEKTKSKSTATNVLTSVPYHVVKDDDAFGWYTGGREMYDAYDFSHGASHTFKVAVPGSTNKEKGAKVDISFSASSFTSSTNVVVTHNNQKLGVFTVPKFSNFQSAYEMRKSFTTTATAGENAFNFSVSPSNPARLNFIRINYQRELKATDAPYSFSPNTTSGAQLKIKGADADTRLWRIGYFNHPTCEIEGQLENDIFSVNIEEGKQRYVILNLAATYPTPEWDGKVENQDLHGDKNAYDMIILIPESRKLASEAQRLADAHQKLQGLRVKVVDAGQIFNEFSSGTPDATAYRRYLKMLYDRAETEADLPRYLLLFGNCLWDNRMIANENKGLSPKDYLLSFEVTDGFSNPNNTTFPLGEQNSYVTDDYFGWLDDGEGSGYTRNKLDLGIGRFTCSDVETAKILVDKSIDYLSNKKTGAWKNTIYMLADNGNGNLHMNDAETVVKQIMESTHNNALIKKVYNDAYTRISTGTGHTFPTATRILQEAMHQGALVFNYTGHGNPDQLSHSKILCTPDFEVPNTGNLPLWIMASCEISPYDSKRYDIGRAALANPAGGAIAVMCASRAVYSNYNRILNIAYNKYLFANAENGKMNTMGDALRLTKVELVTPSEYGGIKDGSINKLKYLLLGNPALPLAAPTGYVVLDSINGTPLTPSSRIKLEAGSLVRLSGHLTDEKHQELHEFKGSLTATMMDRLEKITCKNNDLSADEPMEFYDRTKKIFEGSDSVINGKFNLSFRIPRDISYTEDGGRITFYAVNNESNIECHGANEQFYLNGTDDSYAPDSLAPKVFLYLNTPEFPNGGITAPHPVFFAKISDDAGINATGIGIGHDMELVIDHKDTAPILLNDYFQYDFGSYREGLVSYPLKDLGLTMGKHTLSFRAWDVNGNSTRNTLDFYIQDGVNKEFDVYASENPAKTTTSFTTTCIIEDETPHTATFEVYDLNGHRIWQSQEVALSNPTGYGIVRWNLTNGGGARVPAGIYLYKVKVKSANGKQESKAKKIIILEK